VLRGDFRDRVLVSGFSLDEFTSDGADAVRYGLSRGDRVFICSLLHSLQSGRSNPS
jgi:hypothetical protein